MSEYAALHSVSLLLVGNNIHVSRSSDSSETDLDSLSRDLESICYEEIPDDELFLDSRKHTDKTKGDQDETTGIETIMTPKQGKKVMVLVDEAATGEPNEARWRAHGLSRRREILEDDMKNGGRNFSLSYDCSVQRYFSVAHWALEQFHQMYESSSSSNDQHQLEEIYVMGFRIISFLSECLPKHPGLKKAPHVEEQCKVELAHLCKCLEDVALRIDEIVCNDCVDEDELFLDSMIAAQMDMEDEESEAKSKSSWSKSSWSSSSSHEEVQLEAWVDFNEFKKLEQEDQKVRKQSESPTSDTIETTGTDSLEAEDSNDAKSKSSASSKSETKSVKSKSSAKSKSSKKLSKSRSKKTKKEDEPEEEENYYLEDDMVIRDRDTFDLEYELDDDEESFTSYSDRPMTLLRKSVSLDFLKTIACEPVLYETDSEAADSWANGEDNDNSRPCLPSSSGVTPTSDPARIAFRNLMNSLTTKNIFNRAEARSESPKELPKQSPKDSPKDQPPSPPDPRSPRSTNIRTVSPTFSDIMEDRKSPEIVSIDDDDLDAIVDSEIEEYLATIFKQEKKIGKGGQPRGALDRKLGKEEPRFIQQESRSVQSEPKPVERRPIQRETRSLSLGTQRAMPDKPRKELNRTSLDHTLGADSPVMGMIPTRSRDSTNKKTVSFDETSMSSNSSSVSGESNATPSNSSYTSLASLRRQTGSQTSAFSAYNGPKQIQSQPQPQVKKLIQPKPVARDKVAVNDDWISFDNFESGSSFFMNESTDTSKKSPHRYNPKTSPRRSGLC